MATLCIGALLLVGCGGSVSDNEWTLEGVSPDQQHLVVSTLFGGVASGCTRFEGWELTETEDAIEIKARLWRQRAPSDCTSEGVVETLQVDLDRPLGDRELVGCGADDCRSTAVGGGNTSVGQVVVSGEAVVVADENSLDAYSPSGELITEIPGSTSGEMMSAGGSVVVRNDRQGFAIATNARSGEELWRTPGWLASVQREAVYLCRGQDSDGLTAVDATTGTGLWSTDLACQSLVVHEESLTVVGIDRLVDGGHRVTVVEAQTGAVLADEAIFDGVDDQVTGFDGAVAVGASTVVAGPQADLVVLSSDGTELDRRQQRLGGPLGVAGGVAILGSHDRLGGYDLVGAAPLWTVSVNAHTSVSVSNGSVWVLDQTGAEVLRLDPLTGDALWSTPIGVTTRFDVAGDTARSYILTTQAIVAVDTETGSLRWSRHRPYAPEN